jgi:streptogramin lyase
MKTNFLKLLATVILISGFSAASYAQTSTFTEWATPSTGSQPLHIVQGAGNFYYFTESAKDRIGLLSPGANVISEWPLPPGSMPHHIEFSSGLVYLCAFGGNYVATFNPTVALLTMWATPTPNSGTIHLDLLSPTQIYFSEATANKIGFLNTATGQFEEWTIPTANSTPRGVAVGQGSNQVFFAELAGKKIGMLDASTNTITEWAFPVIKQVEHVHYANGLVYFGDLQSNIVATLNPTTNLLTGWLAPTTGADIPDVAPSSGNVYFTERAGNKIGLLNPALQKGTSKTLVPTVTPVTPVQTTVTPSTSVLESTTTNVTPTVTNVTGTVKGGFTEWAVPTSDSGPLGMYANGTTVAYAEYYGNKVAILVPAP